ncbi:MAG: SUMF1/EgtB/PvdO family nonheme iron enzyme [Saprospiraceae bacterium]|nr:SUMF1/EgtB/PvdO family nonheme iron enzyme [Saprospiraceae bacterium]
MKPSYLHTLLQLLLHEWSQQQRPIETQVMLRIQQVVSRLSDQTTPVQLRNMLAAILARSEQEQKEFYALFKKCEAQAQVLCEVATAETNTTLTKAPDKSTQKIWKWWLIIRAIILAIIAFLFGVFWLQPKKDATTPQLGPIRRSVFAGDTSRVDLKVPSDTAQLNLVSPDSRQTTSLGNHFVIDSTGVATFIASADSEVNVADTVRAQLYYSSRVDTVQAIITILPTVEQPPPPNDSVLAELDLLYDDDISHLVVDPNQINQNDFWEYWEWPIKILLSLLIGGLLWAIHNWQRYKQAQVIAEIKKANKAPYIWTPQSQLTSETWLDEVAQPLINRFRGRTPDQENSQLDIPATIEATTREAGRLQLRHAFQTLPPNYLLLIDRYHAQDHEARLFDALYQRMKQAEVPVHRYYFNGDPRLCTNEAFPNGISLIELLHKHASARLIIVGEGQSFLSPVSGRLAPWTQLLKKWKNRVLLNPKIQSQSNALVRELDHLLLVLPASPQGLNLAVETFLSLDSPSRQELLPKMNDLQAPPIVFDRPMMDVLKDNYSTPQLDWIAACAVWPQLSWDLTLHLGETIGEHHQQKVLSFAHLREMNRLPWFRQGQIPQRAREQLLQYLEERGLIKQVRTALMTLLDDEKVAPPKDALAYADYRMNIILNELSLQPDPARKRELEKEFANYLAAGKKPDFVAFKLLDRPANRFETLIENTRLKRLAFRDDLPGFRWKHTPLYAIGWFLLSAFLLWFPIETEVCENGNLITYKDQNLCLSNAEDSLLYLQHLAKDAIEAQQHERVDSIRQVADAIVELDSAFHLNTAYNYYNYGAKAWNCSLEEGENCDFEVSNDSLKTLACDNFRKVYELRKMLFPNDMWERYAPSMVFCDFEALDSTNIIDTVSNENFITINGVVIDSITEEPISNAIVRIGYAKDVSFENLVENNASNIFQVVTNQSGTYSIKIPSESNTSIQVRVSHALYEPLEIRSSSTLNVRYLVLMPNEDAFIDQAQASNQIEDYQAYLDRFPKGRFAEDFQQVLDVLKDNISNNPVDIEELKKIVERKLINYLEELEAIGDKSNSNERKKQSISNAKQFFTENAVIETTNLRDITIKEPSSVEEYLNKLKALPYQKVGIDFDESNIKVTLQDSTNNQFLFESTFTESFEGTNSDGRSFKDITKKKIDITATQVESGVWEIKFGNITIIDNNSIPIPPTVLVPGGTFIMGCLSKERDGVCDEDEKPSREVTVSTFYIGQYEVTNEEFAAFLNEEGNQEEGGTTWVDLSGSRCRIKKEGDQFVVEQGYEKHPMVQVSWYGARAYCAWLSKKTGESYRLPSEAHWEYAARGGAQGAKDNFLYSGSDDLEQVAWFNANSENRLHSVGQKQPNQLGIYDMSGNVWEWCADPWHGNYIEAPEDGRVWEQGGIADRYVVRGGSWGSSSYDCRVSNRYRDDHYFRYNYIGFRVSRN